MLKLRLERLEDIEQNSGQDIQNFYRMSLCRCREKDRRTHPTENDTMKPFVWEHFVNITLTLKNVNLCLSLSFM